MDENLKTIGRDLWRDKPLLIAVLAAVGVIVYILIKNSQAGVNNAVTGSGNASTLPTGAGGTYVEDTYNIQFPTTTILNTITGQPAPITLPTPPRQSGPIISKGPISATHNPGTTFLGPTGVKHYVATGSQTLSQIANHFGLQSWNSIYAIPDNMKLFGKMDANHARSYKPRAGQTITLPGNTSIGF